MEVGGFCILLWEFGLQETLLCCPGVRWQEQRWEADVARMGWEHPCFQKSTSFLQLSTSHLLLSISWRFQKSPECSRFMAMTRNGCEQAEMGRLLMYLWGTEV